MFHRQGRVEEERPDTDRELDVRETGLNASTTTESYRGEGRSCSWPPSAEERERK